MRRVITALIATAAGLAALLSFRSHTTPGLTVGTSALGANGGGGTQTQAPAAQGPSTQASAGPSAGASASTGGGTGSGTNGTFTGTAADTQFGPVQVRITVAGGKLTDVTVLQVPDNGRYEQQIVQQAVPILRSEALSSQNANINIVSGATYTSQGYAQSLQSALDQAKL